MFGKSISERRDKMADRERIKKIFKIIIATILSALIVAITFGGTFLFLETTKKLGFFDSFIKTSNNFVEFKYYGNESLNIEEGMRNIVLKSENGQDFTALICFKID